MKNPQSRRSGGFTLIELMTVITIIAILAALTMGVFTYAQQKAHRDMTTTWSVVISQALSQYYEKFGEYPDSSNAHADTEPGITATLGGAKYDLDGAVVLYQAITGDGSDQLATSSNNQGTASDGVIDPTEVPNAIITDLPKQMVMKATADSGKVVYMLVDGFSHPFEYFKGKPPTGSNNTPLTVNPKYDLWSYAQNQAAPDGGGTMPYQYADRISTTGNVNSWIKNW